MLAKFHRRTENALAITRHRRILVDYHQLNVLVEYDKTQEGTLYPQVPEVCMDVETVWGVTGVPRSPLLSCFGTTIVNRSFKRASMRRYGRSLCGVLLEPTTLP